MATQKKYKKEKEKTSIPNKSQTVKLERRKEEKKGRKN